jgi:hypothetical protein
MSDCGNCNNCGGVLKPGAGCGCLDCPPGAAGPAGADGKTAYELWIDAGNTGTVTDFLNGLVGPQGPAGTNGTNGVPCAKINFYSEVSSVVHVKDSTPNPTIYNFPAGYAVNTFTNTSGSTKKFIVHGSYETEADGANAVAVENVVDGAIIKTVSGVDSVQWESLGTTVLTSFLFDGPSSSDTITRNSIPDTVVTDPNRNAVETRFLLIKFPKNVAFFKSLTLNNNETVSLKFKTKDASAPSKLLKAQMFVLEIDT